MTSKNLLVNITYQKYKQNRWIFTAISIILFFTTTFQAIAYKINQIPNAYLFTLQNNYFLILATILFAIMIPIVLFKFINSKSEVDFYHSLPIKREKIFISNYILGLLLFLVPFALNILATLLLSTSNYEQIFWNITITSITNLVTGFVGLYSFTTFAVIITGNIFMSVCTTLGVMFFPTVLMSYKNEIFNIFYDTYVSNFDPSKLNIITNLIYNNHNFCFYNMIYAIFAVFALVLYKKRPSENASNPVAINIFKPIIKYMGVIGASALGGFLFYAVFGFSAFTLLLGSIICGGIIHGAFEVIFDGDFSSIFKNIKGYVVYSIILCVVIVGIQLNAENFDNKLPCEKSIKSVTLSMNNEQVTLFDEENIKTVLEIAKYAKDNTDSPESLNITVDFEYSMGSNFKRHYANTSLKYSNYELYDKIISTDEFIKDFTNYESLDRKNISKIEYINDNNRYFIENHEKTIDALKSDIENIDLDTLKNSHPIFNVLISFEMEDDLERIYWQSEAIPVYNNFYNTLDVLDYTQEEVILKSAEIFYVDANNNYQSVNKSITDKETMDLINKYKIKCEYLPYAGIFDRTKVIFISEKDTYEQYFIEAKYFSEIIK